MQKRKLFTLLSAGLLTAITVWLRNQGAPLTIPGVTPLGILNLEFAWNEEMVQFVKNAWRGPVLKTAQVNIYIDFLYIVAYTTFLHLVCTGLAANVSGRLSNWGQVLGKAMIAAGVFDVAENSLMLLSISQPPNNYTAAVTALFAGLKFAIIITTLLYIIVAAIVRLLRLKRASA